MITERWPIECLRNKINETDRTEGDWAKFLGLPSRRVQDMDSEECFDLIDLPVGHEVTVVWPDGNIGRGLSDIVAVAV